MINYDKRGSIWRRWDLHIHTPASFHWNGGKKFAEMNELEYEKSIKGILEQIEKSNADVFGIMDYFTLEGYFNIIDFIKAQKYQITKTILPGMEVRVEAPTSYRMNFHFIFSDELTRQNLIDFCSKLEIRIKDKARSISREAFIELGKSYGDDVAKTHGFSKPISQLTEDQLSELGYKTAEITRESIEKAIDFLPEKSVLKILPFELSGGFSGMDWKKFSQASDYFLSTVDIIESRSDEIVDLVNGTVTEKNKSILPSFQKSLGKPKPAICGSDAHKISDYGKSLGGKSLWIKADPTWRGLQIVLNEPSTRCYLGEFPEHLKRVQENKTKYIKNIQISKIENSDIDEDWFDNEINFNSGLITIIGNKGSGKSALVDILGLLCNSQHEESFSFLNKQKFRQPSQNKSRNFTAKVEWESGRVINKGLNENTNDQEPRLVNYIPQDCFEIICNELAIGKDSSFDKELKSVLFSHVSIPDRLGTASFDELIDKRTSEISSIISFNTNELHKLNEKIVDSEEKFESNYKNTLINSLEDKKRELEAHDSIKPKEVIKPENKSEAVVKKNKKIESKEKKRDQLKTQIEKLESRQEQLALTINNLGKICERLNLLKIQIQQVIDASKKDLDEVGINVSKILDFKIDTNLIDQKIVELKNEKENIKSDLDIKCETSKASQLSIILKQIEELNKELDLPMKNYKKYLDDLDRWKKRREGIIGKPQLTGSIKYFENEIKNLEKLPQRIQDLQHKRDGISKKIYQDLKDISSIYSELYQPVQRFISEHTLAKGKFDLNFDVSIFQRDFDIDFFNFISRGVNGSFYGQDEGLKILRNVIEKTDFNNENDHHKFVNEILELLNSDYRTGNETKITDQLKKGHSLIEFYDFLYSLSFLEPKYTLKMGDKFLSELSPGEKGSLLLVFYLLIDKSDIPLIIDQPEHNLDNETIYSLLVPAIKEAATRRQIIIVSHNPNISVVCDADQIIYAHMDKKGKNKVTYITGSIENPEINMRIVDILEGTKPAFENRSDKYSLPVI